MVGVSDLKVYESLNSGNSTGGGIDTSSEITTATPNNIFLSVTKAQLASDFDHYKCVYFKNTHATEAMDNFKLWLSTKSPSGSTELKWGFDPVVAGGGYRWSPYFDATGSTFDSTASSAPLQLTEFTVAAWFNTDASYTTNGFIVNKGGSGSDTAGQNDNYSLKMSATEKISFGFEQSDGTDHYATSPLTYNDGLWHLAVGTYRIATGQVKLYVDDMVTPVATHSTGTTPETAGTNPVVIGRNSRASDQFFTGWIDEVRIWNVALSEASRVNLLDNNIAQVGLVFEKKFGTDDGVLVAQEIIDVGTEPLDVEWLDVESEPAEPNVGKLVAGGAIPVWLWRHIDQDATARLNDSAIFSFEFDIPVGGTGSGGGGGSGGGTGGNPPPTPTDYKIAIVGDEGVENETEDVIDLIDNQNYDFVVSVGDHGYGDDGWFDLFTPLKSIMQSAYGNHEYDDGVNDYKTFFGHSKTYYTFKVQNIQFFVFDTNINCDIGSTQYNEMKTKLEASQTDNTVTWRVAVFHHPQFGADSQHSYNDAETIEAFTDIFLDNHINFVCTGHNHNWQRTDQIEPDPDNPEDPTVIDSSSPYSRTARAYIHVVSGTGGHDSGSSLYDLGSQPAYQAYQNNTHNGVWELVASNSGNTLTCSFVDTGGSKFDTFTITA